MLTVIAGAGVAAGGGLEGVVQCLWLMSRPAMPCLALPFLGTLMVPPGLYGFLALYSSGGDGDALLLLLLGLMWW